MKDGNRMKRRSFIAGAGAAALPYTAAQRAGAGAGADAGCDPILAHYDDWRAANVEFMRLSYEPGNGNMDSPESCDAQRREFEALGAMLDMTPISQAGIAALAHVLWEFHGPYLPPSDEDFQANCNEQGNRLIAAIWRAASGKGGLPPMSEV